MRTVRQRGLATGSWPRRPRSSRADGVSIFLIDPHLDSGQCVPLWTEAVCPAVIHARCTPCDPAAPLALDLAVSTCSVAAGTTGEHVGLATEGDPIRLDIIAGSVLDGPVRIEPAIALERVVAPQLTTVARIGALLRSGRMRAAPDARLPRLVLALRALDAWTDGANLRVIARDILGRADWPGEGDCVKSMARRLVALGKALPRAGASAVLRRNL